MPYRRRHIRSRGEKLILYGVAGGFSLVAVTVVAFLVFGGKIFGTMSPPASQPTGPNTLAPGTRPPPPVIRQAPPVRPAAPPPAPAATPTPPRPASQPLPGQIPVTPPRQ